ncbi:phage holin family protein [Gorillibacterium massiliense]|uniref:phage holin family protein n=1 Tax=Gorillibacterium massiliense TaxID=1280390 RepID=UPI0004B1D008|nr:phage holin family protein [Gorillibacterium massiliense]
MTVIGAVVRFVVSAIALLVAAWLVPGFSVGGFGSALVLALVIAVLGWVVESLFNRDISPFGRGIVGFLLSALVIWLSQFIVGNVKVTLLGALLAALVVGIIDLFVPTGVIGRNKNRNRGRA